MRATAVRLTAFGEGQHSLLLSHPAPTVADVLRSAGVTPARRRVAVNGNVATTGTGVLEGDEVTVIPRVQGG